MHAHTHTYTQTHTHARTYGVNSERAEKLTHWMHRLRSFNYLGGNVAYLRHGEPQTNCRGLNTSCMTNSNTQNVYRFYIIITWTLS
jgi:mannose-6-phosphate isomerase class I